MKALVPKTLQPITTTSSIDRFQIHNDRNSVSPVDNNFQLGVSHFSSNFWFQTTNFNRFTENTTPILRSNDAKYWIEARYEGSPPERRAHHATFIFNNTVYIHGGEDLYDGIIGNMWSFSLEFMNKSNVAPKWQSVTQ